MGLLYLFLTIFMYGIHNYIPETKHISRVHNVAAVLYLRTVCATCNVISPVKYVLYLYISTFLSMCVVPNAAVYCSSLTSCFPGTLLMYCLSVFLNGSTLPYFYWYHFCFHIPHALNSYYEIFILFSLFISGSIRNSDIL